MRFKNAMIMAKSLLQASIYRKKTPLIVSLVVTNRCNSWCKYCGTGSVKTKELDTKQTLSIIEELSRLGTRQVQFTGGEPLLRDDIGQLIDLCKKKGMNTVLNTNGSLVKKNIGALANLYALGLSLDGHESTHDYLRGEGSYNSVMQAAEIAKDKNIRLRFTTVLSNHNLKDIDFILGKAKAYKAQVLFQPARMYILMSKAPNPVAAPREEYKKAIAGLQIMKKKSNYIANSPAALRYLYNWPLKTKILCLKGLVACRVESNGDVCTCSRTKDVINPLNCLEHGFQRAFYQLPVLTCDCCWCAGNVEINCLLALRLSTIFNASKFV